MLSQQSKTSSISTGVPCTTIENNFGYVNQEISAIFLRTKSKILQLTVDSEYLPTFILTKYRYSAMQTLRDRDYSWQSATKI